MTLMLQVHLLGISREFEDWNRRLSVGGLSRDYSRDPLRSLHPYKFNYRYSGFGFRRLGFRVSGFRVQCGVGGGHRIQARTTATKP